ncbi:putative chondroitin sulfate synthase 1 [Sciurus carolinensis]|uniref:Chondroitin sulfate synthase 1 n=1 Tax=Sciurus carolinensis TaxID=30640 RepID=A0AA41N0Q2_SCICA|nr:putative chondroitin sulfate synthase 1 [Sciurus carolinensis]
MLLRLLLGFVLASTSGPAPHFGAEVSGSVAPHQTGGLQAQQAVAAEAAAAAAAKASQAGRAHEDACGAQLWPQGLAPDGGQHDRTFLFWGSHDCLEILADPCHGRPHNMIQESGVLLQ